MLNLKLQNLLMEILTSFLVMALWLGIVLLSRIITTTVHELGHAIPALVFTEKEVIVHIGSYGSNQDIFLLPLGRLKVYFKFNLTHLNMGLCIYQRFKDIPKQMIITLGGPVNSLLLALFLIGLIVINDFSDATITILTLFIISALWDFVINLIPTQQPVVLEDGQVCFNDGLQFLTLWQLKDCPLTYTKGEAYMEDGKYQLAIAAFEETLAEGYEKASVYYQLATNYLLLKEYDKVLDTFEIIHDKYGLRGIDYGSIGSVYMHKKSYQEAIKMYHRAIHEDYRNPMYLYGRARSYQEISEHKLALQDFDAALEYQLSYAVVYTYRGLSKLRLGDLDGALRDLKQAEKLDADNPYTYLHLGFYYQKQNNDSLALENFQKAKEMNIDYYGIEYYINEVDNQ